MDDISIQNVSGKNNIKDFVYLPEKLHSTHKNWVPPLYAEEKKYLDAEKNLAFRYCSTIILIAKKNGQYVGRIMGIINHRYNSKNNEKTARFYQFESIDDPNVSNKLLDCVEDWAVEQGMEKMIGPMGMYYHDPMGLMIEGFDEKPSFGANYNYKFLADFLQSAGYSTKEDLVVYKIKLPDEFPEFYLRIKERALRSNKLRIEKIRNKRDIKKFILPVLNLMNETYENILGYSMLDTEEMIGLADKFVPLLNPKLLIIATYQNEVVGFIIALPSLNEGIIAAKGQLFPFGFIKILNAAKKTEQLDLLIGAIKPGFQGKGIDAVMGIHLMETAKKMGFSTLDSHLELESNSKVRAEMEKMGGTIHKRYRIFKKVLK